MVSTLRYMNISDEWETPEKQEFKDFVSFNPFGNNVCYNSVYEPNVTTNCIMNGQLSLCAG